MRFVTVASTLVAIFLALILGQVAVYLGRSLLDHDLAAELPGLTIAMVPFMQAPIERFFMRLSGTTDLIERSKEIVGGLSFPVFVVPTSPGLARVIRFVTPPVLAVLAVWGWTIAFTAAGDVLYAAAHSWGDLQGAGPYGPVFLSPGDPGYWPLLATKIATVVGILMAEVIVGRFYFRRFSIAETSWFSVLPLTGLALCVMRLSTENNPLNNSNLDDVFLLAFACVVQLLFTWFVRIAVALHRRRAAFA